MGFRQARVQLERFQRQPLGFATTLVWRNKTPQGKYGEAIGQACVGNGIGRISGNRLLEKLDSFSESFSAASVPLITAFEIGLECLRVNRMHVGEVRLLLRCQLDLDFPRDSLGEFGLEGERISQITVVTLGPQVRVGWCVEKLGRDAQPLARSLHCSFYYRVNA